MLSLFTHMAGEGGCDPHKLGSDVTRAPHIDDIFEGGEEEEFLDVEDHDDDETLSKSDLRKSSKPVMEKKRRARINHCLAELKTLIVDALNRDPSRHSKLEKADILELTVRHLQEVQRRQLGVAVARDPTVLRRFSGGFAECAQEVNRYVTRIDSVDGGVKQRLVNHLGQCVRGLRAMTPAGFASMAGVPIPPPPPHTGSNPPPIPQYRPPQPQYHVPTGIEEASGSHARALQKLLLARMAADPPPQSVSSHPHQPPTSSMISVKRSPLSPPCQPFHGPPTATPNISPLSGSVLSGSHPVTPQSAKISPSFSSSPLESSPESASQSPPMHYPAGPGVRGIKIGTQTVTQSIGPSNPSLRIKKEEPVSGQLFQNNQRVSAFTAVKSSSSASSSSFAYQSSILPSSRLRQNLAIPVPDYSARSTNTFFDKVFAPTARRLIPNTVHESLIPGIETKQHDQKSPNLTFNATKSLEINCGVNSFIQNRQESSHHQQADNKDGHSGNSYFKPTVSRKRSLDSVYDNEVKHKIAKVEVVKGGPASLPVAGNVPPAQHLVRAQHPPDLQAPLVDEKDMWRPW